jgi:SNF2 family DNA or RNA helicase
VLVVCPTSLKHQWQREIERFTGRSAVAVGGLRPARQAAFAADSFYKITNYDTVHRDLDLIDAWAPDLVILDEAQRIKNWQTRTARSVKKITAPYAVVLTGTPLENRLEELVSIVQFVDRFRLGPTFRLLDRHQVRDEVGKVVGYRHLDRLGQTLAPVLIRRQKAQVLDQLPERIDQKIFVTMTAEQRRHHEENRELVARIVAKWRKYRFLSERDQRLLMVGLQNMRMSCDSSYLLDASADHGVKADELLTLLGELREERGTKVVVFSQWLRMHELIVRRLKPRGWGHVLFHGGVPGQYRKRLIERFRDDTDCRLFLSTDAGGVGLNLQWATVVVNMDLPWNPAVLEQRVGRVHRLGQRRAVRVVNFVAQGTIEEGMLALLDFKRGLFAGVLDGGAKEVFLGGGRLNRFLETVEKATAAIPEAVVEDEPEPEPASEKAPPADDPWAALLDAGRALLDRLTKPTPPGAPPLLERDAKTGGAYLRLPLPPPEVLGPAVSALAGWLRQLDHGGANGRGP